MSEKNLETHIQIKVFVEKNSGNFLREISKETSFEEFQRIIGRENFPLYYGEQLKLTLENELDYDNFIKTCPQICRLKLKNEVDFKQAAYQFFFFIVVILIGLKFSTIVFIIGTVFATGIFLKCLELYKLNKQSDPCF